MSDTTIKPIKGGEFLIRNTKPEEIFSPSEWSEEQQMIAQMCDDFINQEVYPVIDRIDAMEEGLMVSLLNKAGELGMLGMSVPEELGGMGVDFKTSLLATERLGKGHSFSVAYGAHTGIGSLPLLYYGTEAQKAKYIPLLASGEWKAAYCLTEPGSGSDANSGKTKATLSEDGTYYSITGQKMWITNGGFADLMTVFAKIGDDKNLSAFLVEAKSEGVSLNPEEKKMGIKGSSTRQVFFNNVKVPVENMLSEREAGFKIALNILNIGRIKLGAGVLGGSKATITDSVKYSNAIKHHVSEGMDKGAATLKGIEDYAIECAILKVAGSECLDYVADEAVQVYGGMGYSAESPVEKAYRDSRINRIFEGTNEINRMLIVDMLLRKAMKGELDLLSHAMKVAGELMSIPEMKDPSDAIFANEYNYLEGFKKTILMVAGAAVQKLAQSLSKEQEILMNVADIAIQIYQAESVLLRVEKLIATKGEVAAQTEIAIVKTFFYDAASRVEKAGKDAINSFAEGDEARMMLMGLKRFTKYTNMPNVIGLREKIAAKIISENKYAF